MAKLKPAHAVSKIYPSGKLNSAHILHRTSSSSVFQNGAVSLRIYTLGDYGMIFMWLSLFLEL
jgi:hypothetical protein